jgi:hypothetical protein
MTQTLSFYPLVTGNVWTYKSNDGNTYTNQVVGYDSSANRYSMSNSTSVRPVIVYEDEHGMHSDSFEAGKFVMMLKARPRQGDAWNVIFHANGLQNKLEMKVLEVGKTIEVEGKTYRDVVVVDAESKMFVNNAWMSINFRTQYHYAPGIGLILTTSSYGDSQALVDCRLV